MMVISTRGSILSSGCIHTRTNDNLNLSPTPGVPSATGNRCPLDASRWHVSNFLGDATHQSCPPQGHTPMNDFPMQLSLSQGNSHTAIHQLWPPRHRVVCLAACVPVRPGSRFKSWHFHPACHGS
ncbi:hypothetical protein RUM44_013836 [Polyplax serrata]|uniref:Uncharacterized protein n=1 Tax=Polyplax serrata TaxID=468196 RepID=A0ABR1BJZ8_POLSC